jgi:mannose-6-phosphate isomerase-like protein (cupin superfamily)
MKVSYGQHAEKRKNSDLCLVTQHKLDDRKEIDFAIVEIQGRYPEQGRVVNQKCKEVVYVQEGSGMVVVEGKELSLKAGDAILIEAGEKYFWDGMMSLFISCTPSWFLEQHQMVV